MGYREYARHRDVNLWAVQKAVKAGRISVTPDGRIDSEKADAQWAASTDAALQRGVQVIAPAPVAPPLIGGEQQVAPSSLSRRLDGPEWPPLTEWEKPAARTGVVISGAGFMAAKTLREEAEAEMAQLELAGKLGKVLDADEARKVSAAVGRMVGQALDGMTQVIPMMVGKTDVREMDQIMRRVIREAKVRLADEIQSRFGEALVVDDAAASS